MAMTWVQTVPRRFRTAARFEAADPWQAGVRSEFSLEECRLLPPHVPVNAHGATWQWGDARLMLLRSDLDGAERLMPEALVELWRQGRVPAEQLPRMLFDWPGEVGRQKAVFLLNRRPSRWLPALLGAGGLGFGLFLWARSWLDAAHTRGEAGSTPLGLIIGILSVIVFFVGMIGTSLGLGFLLATPILALRKRNRRRAMEQALERLGERP